MAVNFNAAATVKAPPARTARKNATTAVQPGIPMRELRAHGLTNLIPAAQGLAVGFKQYADAATMGRYFPPLCDELAALADTYDWLARPIDFLVQTGPLAGILSLAIPMMMQFAANHNYIDGSSGAMGITSPKTLEMQLKAQVIRAQANMNRDLINAQKEMEQAERDLLETQVNRYDSTSVS